MKDNKNDNKVDQAKGINPVAAAVTGAIIGAGAVVAGAIVMSDKNNQKKVEKVVNDAKEKIRGYKAGLEEKSQAVKDDAKVKIEQVSGKVQEMIDVAKEPLEETK
jgi:gas vesicle protein